MTSFVSRILCQVCIENTRFENLGRKSYLNSLAIVDGDTYERFDVYSVIKKVFSNIGIECRLVEPGFRIEFDCGYSIFIEDCRSFDKDKYMLYELAAIGVESGVNGDIINTPSLMSRVRTTDSVISCVVGKYRELDSFRIL